MGIRVGLHTSANLGMNGCWPFYQSLRVAEEMKQAERSCIGAGVGSPEPDIELRR